MSEPQRKPGDLRWLLSAREAYLAGRHCDFTAEQLHVLCVLLEITTIPGLGPLPIEVAQPGSEALMRETALRSLLAWGAVSEEEGRLAVSDDVEEMLHGLANSTIVVYVSRTAADEVLSRLWSATPGSALSVSWITPTDYRLRRVDADRLSEQVLLLVGGDEPCGTDQVDSEPENRLRGETQNALEGQLAGALRSGSRVAITVATRSNDGVQTDTIRLLADGLGQWWMVQRFDNTDGPRAGARGLRWNGVREMVEGMLPSTLDGYEPLLAGFGTTQ